MSVRPLAPYLALAVAGAACAALLAPHFENANILRPFDYMQYWSAGRAVLNGQNPYDGKVLYPYQQQIGTNWAEPVMMWNPPWTLPAAMALGSVHWRAGQLAWLALNLGCMIFSAVMLWRMFQDPTPQPPPRSGEGEKNPERPNPLRFGEGGSRSEPGGVRFLPIILALGFGPTVFLLLLGQISGLILLGVVGFLACVRSNRYVLAGGFLALTAIKPHLLAPFALVLALEAIRFKPLRKTILTGVLVLAAFGALPLLWDMDIWSQYRAGTSASSSEGNNTISEWVHPTIGFLLREALPGQPRWAMFVPLMIALPLVAVYWWKRSATWNWSRELPGLILISLVAAPYGAWGFDLVLLLIPVVQAAVWLLDSPKLKLWIYAYAAFNAVLLLTLFQQDSMTNYWITPVVLGGYLMVKYSRQPHEATARWETVPQ
jgi:hypothetical protein